MKNHNNANEALADIAQNLQDQMDEKNAKATVIIGKNKMQTLNEYAFLFAANLNSVIDDYDLSKQEIRIVLKLIEYMYFGNLLSFSNSRLAKDLKMDPSNVSKAVKRLKDSELIVNDCGNLFFNPHIACKGTLDERIPEMGRILDYSAIVLEEHHSKATPSIATRNIRNKNRQTCQEKADEISQKIKDFYG